MKRRAARKPQHGKNRSRPRGWHRGRAAGRIQARALATVEAAEVRAHAIEAELVESRADLADHAQIWRDLARVSPIVPRWAS